MIPYKFKTKAQLPQTNRQNRV